VFFSHIEEWCVWMFLPRLGGRFKDVLGVLSANLWAEINKHVRPASGSGV
jgi:hypothetical protein